MKHRAEFGLAAQLTRCTQPFVPPHTVIKQSNPLGTRYNHHLGWRNHSPASPPLFFHTPGTSLSGLIYASLNYSISGLPPFDARYTRQPEAELGKDGLTAPTLSYLRLDWGYAWLTRVFSTSRTTTRDGSRGRVGKRVGAPQTFQRTPGATAPHAAQG